MHVRGRVVSFLAAAMVAVIARPAAAELPSGRYEYTIRHPVFGQIGTHTAEVRRDGADLVVLTSIRLSVDLPLVHLYTFESTGREVWRDGRLVEANASTNDNGTRMQVSARLDGDRFVVDGPKGHIEASGPIGTTTFWNADAVTAPLFWEPTSGLFYKVGISAAGQETVWSSMRTFSTRKYVMTGEIRGDLWYADDGTWVRMDFEKYGSTLTIQLASVQN